MAKHLKLWTTLGIAAFGTASLANASPLPSNPSAPVNSALIFAQASEDAPVDANGEGGGESGSGVPSTYALDSTDPNAFQYDARPQIEAYAELVRMAYEKSAADADALKASVEALLASPSQETLAAARAAWVAARPAYMRTEAFRFYDGPIEEVEAVINSWPLNEAYIDYVEGDPKSGLINDAEFPLETRYLERRNQKHDEKDVTVGWHAIEFLLWGQDHSTSGPGNRPYTDFTAGQGSNDRRRLYLQLVTDDLSSQLHALADQWQHGNTEGYAANFLSLAPREAIGRMINGMAILAGFEFMSERLGVALDSGDQEDEQSCFSDNTKQDFVTDLEGLYQVWSGDSEGTTRPGLNDLVSNIDSATADKVERLFTDAKAKVDALGDPWDRVLAAPKDSPERKAAEDLVTALQALSDGLVEAGSKLGVLVLVPNG